MTRLSILVPTLAGSDERFEDTLAAVLRNQPADSEIIAVHDGSYRDPHDLRGVGVRVVQVRGATSPGELLAASLVHCRSPLVHVLRPGILVDEGWTDAALAALDDPTVAAVTPLILQEQPANRLVAAGLDCTRGYRVRLVAEGRRYRSGRNARFRPLGPTVWAAFYRIAPLQSVLRTLGGRFTGCLDLEIALAIRELSLANRLVPESWVTIEHPDLLVSEYRRVSGADSQRLAFRHQRGTPRQVVRSTLLRGAAELLAGLWRPRQALHAIQRLPQLWSAVAAAQQAGIRERLQTDYARSLTATEPRRRAAA